MIIDINTEKGFDKLIDKAIDDSRKMMEYIEVLIREQVYDFLDSVYIIGDQDYATEQYLTKFVEYMKDNIDSIFDKFLE